MALTIIYRCYTIMAFESVKISNHHIIIQNLRLLHIYLIAGGLIIWSCFFCCYIYTKRKENIIQKSLYYWTWTTIIYKIHWFIASINFKLCFVRMKKYNRQNTYINYCSNIQTFNKKLTFKIKSDTSWNW